MNRNLLTMALLICGLSVNGQKKIDYVDPLIGTNGMGHTFPGACVPHGLVQLSPDTDTIPHNINGTYQPRVYEYCAGYQHRDSSIVGLLFRDARGLWGEGRIDSHRTGRDT